jgi:hypothetical protein
MLGALAVLPAMPAAAAAEPDRMIAVVERHREFSADCDAAVAISARMAVDDPEFEAADAITGERQDRLNDHAAILVRSEPTTLAGVVTLMRYVASLEEWQEPVDQDDSETEDAVAGWHQVLLSTLANAIEKISAMG